MITLYRIKVQLHEVNICAKYRVSDNSRVFLANLFVSNISRNGALGIRSEHLPRVAP